MSGEKVLSREVRVALFDERGGLAGTYRNVAALKLNGYGGFSLEYWAAKGYTVGKVEIIAKRITK